MRNDHRFKLSAVVQNCREILDIGQEIAFQGSGSVIGHNIKDNHDGTNTVTALIKPSLIDVRTVTQGVIEAPVYQGDTQGKSPSKKLRDKLFILHTLKGNSEDTFEAYYEKVIEKILEKVDREIDDINNEGLL